MTQALQVVQGPNGVPIAHVPSAVLHDLVEYLSFQRVAVTYHFELTHFTVTFPHSDLATARRLLDDWSHCQELHGQPA